MWLASDCEVMFARGDGGTRLQLISRHYQLSDVTRHLQSAVTPSTSFSRPLPAVPATHVPFQGTYPGKIPLKSAVCRCRSFCIQKTTRVRNSGYVTRFVVIGIWFCCNLMQHSIGLRHSGDLLGKICGEPLVWFAV